jgi:exopolyphosphatase
MIPQLLCWSLLAFTEALQHHQPGKQIVVDAMKPPKHDVGVGHFSEWSRDTKKQFLIDWQAGKESEWIFVMVCLPYSS